MFRSFALASAAVLATVPAAAQTSGDLAAVQRHLAGVQTMTANFSQSDRKGKTLTGQLTLKRPGKIRFQYEKGVPLLIVGDGKALTFIDYQVRQVSRWPIGNSPLGLLLNPAADISRVAKIVPSTDPRMVIVQARDPRRPQYGTLTLAFTRQASAPAGLMLQGWVALDAQNNRTTVTLSNPRFNVAVSDDTFRWSDPRRKGRPG